MFILKQREFAKIHNFSLFYIIQNSEVDGSEYFNDPKNCYRSQLLININFHPGIFGDYYGRSIGYEPGLLVVVFSNFNEEFMD